MPIPLAGRVFRLVRRDDGTMEGGNCDLCISSFLSAVEKFQSDEGRGVTTYFGCGKAVCEYKVDRDVMARIIIDIRYTDYMVLTSSDDDDEYQLPPPSRDPDDPNYLTDSLGTPHGYSSDSDESVNKVMNEDEYDMPEEDEDMLEEEEGKDEDEDEEVSRFL